MCFSVSKKSLKRISVLYLVSKSFPRVSLYAAKYFSAVNVFNSSKTSLWLYVYSTVVALDKIPLFPIVKASDTPAKINNTIIVITKAIKVNPLFCFMVFSLHCIKFIQ